MQTRNSNTGGKAGLMALIACTVLASHSVLAEGTAAEPTVETRLVYVPQKQGYPFNLREVPHETAQFARVEIAPDSATPHRGPTKKTGHPFQP